MKTLLRAILSAKRKRREVTVGASLWLLRIVRDIENAEMDRHSDLLDELDLSPGVCSSRYTAVEDDYSECELSLDFLDSAIDYLESAYWRF